MVRCIGQQRIEQLPLLIQFGLRPLVFRDIPEDDLGPDDLTLPGSDRHLADFEVVRLPATAVFFNIGESLAGAFHQHVVMPVFLRQFLGEEVVVGLAEDLFARQAQQPAEGLVGERDPSLQILARHMDRQVLHQRAIERLQVLLGLPD